MGGTRSSKNRKSSDFTLGLPINHGRPVQPARQLSQRPITDQSHFQLRVQSMPSSDSQSPWLSTPIRGSPNIRFVRRVDTCCQPKHAFRKVSKVPETRAPRDPCIQLVSLTSRCMSLVDRAWDGRYEYAARVRSQPRQVGLGGNGAKRV